MSAVEITQGIDLYVTAGEDRPADVILDQAILSEDTVYLTKFPTGFVDFASILDDTLTLTVAAAVAAGVELQVDLVGEEWSPATVTGANPPDGVGTPITVGPLGALAAGDKIELPIGPLMQTIADNSAEWRGLRVDVTDGGPVKVWTFRADADVPVQSVNVQSTLPKPTSLSPAGGRYVSGPKVPLRVKDYARQLGDLEIAQMRVQWAATNGGSILADETQDTSTPDFDMEAETFSLLGVGLRWWRTQLKGSGPDGVWSPWSDWESTQFAANPDLTATYPPPAPGNVAYDTDPELAWDFDGTQTAYKVTRRTLRPGVAESLLNVPARITSAVQSARIGAEILDYYPVQDVLEVWDDKDREAVPGYPDHAIAVVDYSIVDDAAIRKPRIIDVALSPENSPYVRVVWTGDAPKFRVRVNGDIVSGLLDPDKVEVGDGSGTYAWTWYGAVPNTLYTIRVQGVKNGRGSSTSDQQDVLTAVAFWWLSNPTTGDHIMFLNFDPGEFERPEPRTHFWAPSQGSSRWRKQRGNRLGYRARPSGELWHSEDNLRTAASQSRAFDRMLDSDDTLMLHGPGEVIPCQIASTSSTPIDDDFDLPRKVAFDMAQLDDSTLAGDDGAPAQGITTLIDFDTLPAGLSDGDPIPADTAIMVDVVGGAFADADAAMHDSALGMTLPNTVAGSYVQLIVNPLEHIIDVYCKGLSALPSGGKTFLRWSNQILGKFAVVELGSAGSFKLKDKDDELVEITSAQVDPDMPFRLVVAAVTHLEDSETIYSLKLWTGDNMEGDNPDSQFDGLALDNGGQAPDEKVELGALSTPGYVSKFDDIRIVNNSAEWGRPLGDEPPPPPPVEGVILAPGASTQTSILVGGYMAGTDLIPIDDDDVIGVNVSTSASMTSPVNHVAGPRDPDYAWMPKLEVAGLTAGTRYWFQPTRNGTPIGQVQSGRTRKALGTPVTNLIAVGGCHRGPKPTGGSVDLAFRDMAGLTDGWIADRLVHLGDFSYPNDLTTDIRSHLQMHARALLDAGVEPALIQMAIDRITSDHETNGHGPSNWPNYLDPITAASLLAWKMFLPYPMADGSSAPRGRYWSAQEGNYRDVYLDYRTLDRTDVNDNGRLPTDLDSTLLGPVQEAWLETEAIAAAAAGQLMFLWTDASWLGETPVNFRGANGISGTFSDKPPSYAVSRDRISNMLASHLGDNVFIAASDSHICQQDDGTNELNGFASIVAGPLDNTLHAHFQASYQTNYPSTTAGDGTLESGGDPDGITRKAQQYQRLSRSQSGSTITVTATIRDCTAAVSGTPKTIGTPMTKTYTV